MIGCFNFSAVLTTRSCPPSFHSQSNPQKHFLWISNMMTTDPVSVPVAQIARSHIPYEWIRVIKRSRCGRTYCLFLSGLEQCRRTLLMLAKWKIEEVGYIPEYGDWLAIAGTLRWDSARCQAVAITICCLGMLLIVQRGSFYNKDIFCPTYCFMIFFK